MAVVVTKSTLEKVIRSIQLEILGEKNATRVKREVASSLKDHIEFFKRVLRETRFSGGDGLVRRTDKLLKSVKGQTSPSVSSVTGDTRFSVSVEIGGPDLPQTRVQETGRVITPKNRKYMYIPLDAVRDPKTQEPTIPSISNIPQDVKTAIIKTRAGNRVLIGTFRTYQRARSILKFKKNPPIIIRKGKKVTLLLYLLRKRVRLKPRLKFLKTFNSNKVAKHRRELVERAVFGALERARNRLNRG